MPQEPRLPAVDLYIAKAPPFAQPILTLVRDAMHGAAPGVEEAMKWSRPFFVYRGIILGNMAAFKEHCSFGLWGEEIAAALRDQGALRAESMGSFGRITGVQDLPSPEVLAGYIRLAAQRIDEGTRTRSLPVRARVAKPAVDVPATFAAALRQNETAAGRFEEMSPSCRREYCEWIGSAKREETRNRRVQQAVDMIADGKSRNWKYEAR